MMDRTPEALLAEIGRDLQPVRPLRAAWVRALALLPWAALSLLVLSLALGPQWSAEGPLSLLTAGLQLLLAYGIVALVLRDSVPGQGTSAAALAAAALAAGAAHAGANLLLQLGRPPMAPPPGLEVAMGLRCLGFSLLLGLPLCLTGLWLAWRGLPMRPAAAGALGGLAAGLAATAVWQLFCAGTDLAHVLPWHGGALLALGGVGLLAGLGWRATRAAAWSRRRRP